MQQSANEIFKYLKMVYKRRHLAIVLALMAMSTIILGSYFLPKKYKADSTVFIEKNVINNLVKGIAITPDMSNRIRVLKYALLSRDLISKVLTELDVDTRVQDPAEMQKLISDLQERTNIKVKGQDLFIVSITDSDPVFAQDFLNTLVGKYVEENIASKRDESYGAKRFLDEQLSLFKNKVDQSENEIIEFRKKHGILFSESEQAILREIKEYRISIEGVNLEIETLDSKIERLKGQAQTIEPTVSLLTEEYDFEDTLSDLEDSRISELEMRLEQLLVTYTENYPEVVKLTAEVESLKKMVSAAKELNGKGEGKSEELGASTRVTSVNPIYQHVQQQIMEVESEVTSLVAKKTKLQTWMAEKGQELESLSENRQELGVLLQQRDSHKKIYDELLLRMGKSEVSKQMEIGDKATTFRIVDPAIQPRKPAFPDPVKMILFAIVAGLGCGVGAAVLLESANPSVKEVEQIKGFGVEILAVIPTITDPILVLKRKRRDLLVYALSGVYMCGIFGLLGYELLVRMGKIV